MHASAQKTVDASAALMEQWHVGDRCRVRSVTFFDLNFLKDALANTHDSALFLPAL